MAGEGLRERIEALYARHTHGIKPGLETTRALLARLGNPERRLSVVHVAGTNGKGSVCAMLDSIFRACGSRTGLYTSPHLVRFNERFRVDGAPIADGELEPLMAAVEDAARAVAKETGREATFFECGTALAFRFFADRGVDLAVVETGMGGRLDATNVVVPLVSVITRIDMDHMAYLGDSIEAIAAEKCGIIKPGRPVVCGAMRDEAVAIVRRTAADRGAPLREAPECVSVARHTQTLEGQKVSVSTAGVDYGTLRMRLLGDYQVENLATVIAVIESLRSDCGLPIGETEVREGVSRAEWPGRCQVVGYDPVVVLDGGHNPDAARALVAALRPLLGRKPLGLIAGMCGDKDAEGFMRAWTRHARRAWLVPIRSERSIDAARFEAAAGVLGCPVARSDLDHAIRDARAWATANGGAVCVAGSLFLVGEALAAIEEDPAAWGRAKE